MKNYKEELIETSSAIFESIIVEPYHVFNTVSFANLNKNKCDEIVFLLYKDSKYRLGLIAGIKDGMLLSSFSAPFGGFSFLKKDVQISTIEKAIIQLENFAKNRSIKGIHLKLPPSFYNETFLSKQINVLYREGYRIKDVDLDFYIPLQIEKPIQNLLWKNARKNLRISQQYKLKVEICNNKIYNQQVIYDVIKANRESKCKPLNMSFEDILTTSTVIPTDFFLLHIDGDAIAGSIVFKVAEGVRYVPFWGDRPGSSSYKPMNYLSYYISEYYQNIGERYLHIGISTENSLPNYGLCEFKESIGSNIATKFSFEKIFH